MRTMIATHLSKLVVHATERGFRKFSFAFFLAALFALIAAPAFASKIDGQFRTWLQTDLWP
ncbi:MAG: lytic murein transglycosylase, partial [Mesorhizobium sp.]